jgi:hypothetical protein
MGEMDRILENFLSSQMEEGLELAAASDIVDLLPLDGPPPQHYVAEFHCRGLVRTEDGQIRHWDHFAVGIHLPDDYLRSVDPFAVLRWLSPPSREHPTTFVWHPNISVKAPIICAGKIAPGTSLTSLLHQLYEIISYQNYTPNEYDALNRECCSWARSNASLFPLECRALRRRTLNLEVERL